MSKDEKDYSFLYKYIKMIIVVVFELLMEKKYFVTGGRGKLGTELASCLSFIAPSREEVDVCSMQELDSAVSGSKVNGIIHLAGISDRKEADKNRQMSYEVNVIGTRNVAVAAKKHKLKLFYVSTDYVFTGAAGNYSESSVPNPANWYGFTKYAGELETMFGADNFCIIRTSFRPSLWGFSTAYKNVYTSADYVDIIAREIALCVNGDISGVIHIGTPVKTFYELAVQRNPDVKPEICTDESFPKRRDLDISKWLRIKNELLIEAGAK